MATRPDARRRGYAGRIVQALLQEGDARGLAGYWLLVMASNAGARSSTPAPDSSEAGRYLYRQDTAQAAPDRLLSSSRRPCIRRQAYG